MQKCFAFFSKEAVLPSPLPCFCSHLVTQLTNTSESDPRSYEVTYKAVTNKAQKKFRGSNGILILLESQNFFWDLFVTA